MSKIINFGPKKISEDQVSLKIAPFFTDFPEKMERPTS